MSQNKIKLAIVENSFAVGGVQKLALDQVQTLDKDKFEILLIVLTQSDQNNFYDLLPEGVRVEKLNFHGLKDFKSWLQLISIIREFKPDIVKSSLFLSNTIVRVLKPFLGFKVITAEHNTNDGKGKLQRFINKSLNTLSYTTIVDSNMVAEHLSKTENIPIDRFTVIHNGVDVKAIEAFKITHAGEREKYRREYGIKENENLFFTVGRLVKQKNHVRMVKAFALFLKKHPDSKLLIIGDGLLKPDIEKVITENKIEDKVILLSARTDIKKYYLMSDFTLLSSDHEGFCIAAMEGLAFGAPLISTRVAGVSEYLIDGENGYFADKTPESLAEKMGEVVSLSEEELLKFKQASVKTSLEYSVDKYGEKFTDLVLRSVSKTEL